MKLLKAALAVTLLGFSDAHRALPASYAALGDSYAAGDGAGSTRLLPHFDSFCGRFSDAYPIQVANSTKLAIRKRCFRNLPCGGASTVSVLKTQVPHIWNSDLVTLTIGGNQVDFFVLLNSCVHQWWPSGSCERAMTKARGLVQSTTFLSNFNDMVFQTTKKLKPGARLLITGYAKFFNEDTDQCDHVTFSRRDPTNFLTKELRKDFNQMVTMLNDVIRAASEVYGATYIDMDRLFKGHRFCEEEVIEPSDRPETWFFNLKFHEREEMGDGGADQQTLPNPIKDFVDLTKTFHPKSLGHKAIAEEIVRVALAE